MQSYSYVNQIRRLQSPVRYQRAGDDDTSRDLAEFYASHWNDLASQGLEPTEEGLWKAETELAGSDTVLFCDDDDGTWQVADVDAFEEPSVSRFERPSLFGGVVRYDWVTYTGKPRGKNKEVAKGWKNSETGEIRYQEKKPADKSGRKNVLKKGGASTPKTKKTAKEHDEDRAAAFSEQGLQAKLAPHADRELTPGDRTKAKRSFAALLKKHGPEKVLHRIDELASETTDPDRLRQLHEMVGWAKGEPATKKGKAPTKASNTSPTIAEIESLPKGVFPKDYLKMLAGHVKAGEGNEFLYKEALDSAKKSLAGAEKLIAEVEEKGDADLKKQIGIDEWKKNADIVRRAIDSFTKSEQATGKKAAAPAPAKPDLHGIVDRMFDKNFADDLGSDRFKKLSKEQQDKIIASSKVDSINKLGKLAKRIENKDIDLVETAKHGNFDKKYVFFRELFTQMTGIKLPTSRKGAEEAVRKYIGEDRIKAAADAAKAKAEEIPGGFKKGQKAILDGREVEVIGGHTIVMQGIAPTGGDSQNQGWGAIGAAERMEQVKVKDVVTGHEKYVAPKNLTPNDPVKMRPRDTKFKPVNAEMTVESATKSGFITKLKGGGWTADGTGGHVFETAAKALTAYLDQQKTAQARRDAAEVEKWKAAPVKAIKDGTGDDATVTVHLPDGSTNILSMRQWRQQVFDIEQKHGDVGYINRDQVPAGFSVKVEPAKAKPATKTERYANKTQDELRDFLQLYQDSVDTKKSKGERIPQDWIDGMSEIRARMTGADPATEIVTDPDIYGHPLRGGNRVGHENIIPIKIDANSDLDWRLDAVQKEIDVLQEKIGKAEYAAKMAKTPSERKKAQENIASASHYEDESKLADLQAAYKYLGNLSKQQKERFSEQASPIVPEPAKSPTMKQYEEFKQQHPDKIGLFRIGDFYETYSDDAKALNKVLGTALTHRGDTAMAGFPHQALEANLQKLLKGGQKVAILDAVKPVALKPALESAWIDTPDGGKMHITKASPELSARMALITQAAGISGKSIEELRRYSDEQLREMIANAGKADAAEEPVAAPTPKKINAPKGMQENAEWASTLGVGMDKVMGGIEQQRQNANADDETARKAVEAIRPFVSKSQMAAVASGMRGEEGQFFRDKMVEIADRIAKMPKTYEQDGKGEEAVAHLHYFTSGGDWYITEKDMDGGVQQAFGLADPFQDGGELGYISIEELVGAGAELDFHFTPKTLKAIKAAKYPETEKEASADVVPDAVPDVIPDVVQEPRIVLANAFADRFRNGEIVTSKDVLSLADAAYGGTRAQGAHDPSGVYDSMEAGFNKALEGKTNPSVNLDDAIKQAQTIAERVNQLPTQTNRSGNKVAFQQFSTPPHYAYAVAWLANLSPNDVVLEPTAGTGCLTTQAGNSGATVFANELDPKRAEFLKDQLGDDKVSMEDASQIGAILNHIQPTVVVMNPPFSQTAGRMGDKKDLLTGAKHITQALQTLQPGGRLVAIVGGGISRDGKKKAGMSPDSATYREWFGKLAVNGYNLRANVGVSGDEYKKYGTHFGTRVLIIDKTGGKGGTVTTGDVETIPELMKMLEGIRNDRHEISGGSPSERAGGTDAQGNRGSDQSGPAELPDAGADGDAGGTAPVGGSEGDSAYSSGDNELPGGGSGYAGSGDSSQSAGTGVAGASSSSGHSGGKAKGTKPKRSGGKSGGKSTKRVAINVPQLVFDQIEKLRVAAPAKLAKNKQVEKEDGRDQSDLGLSVYEDFEPGVNFAGMIKHVTPLVESAAMAAVRLPKITYQPTLSPDLIEGKKVKTKLPDGSVIETAIGASEAGLETICLMGQAHSQFLPAEEGNVEKWGKYSNSSGMVQLLQTDDGKWILADEMGDATGGEKHFASKKQVGDYLVENGYSTLNGQKIDVGGVAYRRGALNGDGTGSGKGRSVAGTIIDNENQGRTKHVWLSKNMGLINDARRDFADMGGDPSRIFEFDKLKGEKPPADGVCFVPYPTLRSGPKDKTKPQNIDILVNWLGKDFEGVVAFDEAHMMANSTGNSSGGRQAGRPSAQALAGIALQQALPLARVGYWTATSATEPDNLLFADRLGLWGRGTDFATKEQFINELADGGTATLEAVAQSMKAMGMYNARMVSLDDKSGRTDKDGNPIGRVEAVKLECFLSEAQKKQYDGAAEGWQHVMKNLDDIVEKLGGKQSGNSQFWGAQQRFFNQVLTCMATTGVIQSIEKDLAEGRAPVVQLVNTMKASMDRAINNREEDQELDEIDVGPKEILVNFLNTSFPTHRMEEYVPDPVNNPERTSTRLVRTAATAGPKGAEYGGRKFAPGDTIPREVLDEVIAGGGDVVGGLLVEDPEAVAMKAKLIEDAEDLKIPESPLDQFIHKFGTDKVAEVTGRNMRFVWDSKGEKTTETRGSGSQEADTQAFQDGRKQILVFSGAGNTGKSYHADKRAKNQGRRVHYVLQPGWSAAPLVQALGRTHRSNQTSAPIIRPVAIPDVPGNKRFLSSASRRLESMGALTRGQRQASGGVYEASDNLESPQAIQGLHRFWERLRAGKIPGLTFEGTLSRLGYEAYNSAGEPKDPPKITQFLNRILILPLDEQNRVFDAFEKAHQDMIAVAIKEGTLDTGVENFPADKIIHQKTDTVFIDPSSGAEAQHVVVKAMTRTGKREWRKNTEGQLPIRFVRNTTYGGKVWAVYDGPQETDPDTGNVFQTYILHGSSGGKQKVPRLDLDHEYSNYKKITQDEAKPIWEAEYAKAPDFKEKEEHFVTGALLPIWKKIPKSGEYGDKAKIFRLKLDNGRTVVGRYIDAGHADMFLRTMGKHLESKQHKAADIHSRLESGDLAHAKLNNGWKLKVVKAGAGGEGRIEIIGPSKHDPDIFKDGVISEIIQHKPRFFIPTGEEGVKVLERITKSRPITEVKAKADEYSRADRPFRYAIEEGMNADQPEQGEDHYHALATMYAEMWNGLEQAGMEPTDRGIWKASEELADGEWILYHDPADEVWKVVQAEQAPKVFRYGKLEYATPPRMFVYRCPYCGGLAYQGDPVQGGVFQAYALCSRCGRGFSILGRDSVEQPRLSYSRTLRYAAHRVPKGYVVNKGGKIYRAGKWVSEADLRTATPVSGAQPAAASASPKGKRVVNRQSLSEKLAPHAGHVLTPEEIKTAKTRFNALSGHHKELVHHRIEELANSTHAALQEAKDPAARKLLSKQMRVYQEMLAWGDAKAKAVEDAKPYAEKVKEKAAKAAPYTAAVKDKRANAKKGAYEGKVAEKRAVAKAKPKPEPKKETSYADKVASKAKPTASYADTVASRRKKKDHGPDTGDQEAFNAVNEHKEPAAEPERDKPISTRDIPEPWGGANEPIQEPESYVEKVKAKTARKSKDDGEDYFALPPKRRPSKFDAATEDLGGKTYAEVIAEKMKKAGATS